MSQAVAAPFYNKAWFLSSRSPVVFKDGEQEHEFSFVYVIFCSRLVVRFSSETAAIASSKAKFLSVESGAQSSFEFSMDFEIYFCAFERQYGVFKFLDNYRVAGYGTSLLHLILLWELATYFFFWSAYSA